MQQGEEIQFPSITEFNINETSDILLKKDFDCLWRKERNTSLLEKSRILAFNPFQHQHFELRKTLIKD